VSELSESSHSPTLAPFYRKRLRLQLRPRKQERADPEIRIKIKIKTEKGRDACICQLRERRGVNAAPRLGEQCQGVPLQLATAMTRMFQLVINELQAFSRTEYVESTEHDD
jgi:hypothetical protein